MPSSHPKYIYSSISPVRQLHCHSQIPFAIVNTQKGYKVQSGTVLGSVDVQSEWRTNLFWIFWNRKVDQKLYLDRNLLLTWPVSIIKYTRSLKVNPKILFLCNGSLNHSWTFWKFPWPTLCTVQCCVLAMPVAVCTTLPLHDCRGYCHLQQQSHLHTFVIF